VWHLIDITYESGVVGIYVDGALIGGGSIGNAETVTPGQGLKVSGASGTFGLDEVAIYPSALSPERIDAHWTVGQSYPGQPACAATPKSPYANAVLADAPIAYYRVDERAVHPAERVAFDSSGHCANATYVDSGADKAATGPVLGDSGTALSRYLNSLFGSVSSGEMLAQNGNMLPAGNSPRTLEAWINEEGQPRYGSYNLFEYGEVATGHGFTVNVGGEPRGTITVSGATQSVHAVAPGGLEGAGWKLVDVTYDGNLVEIYIDGQLIGGGEIGSAETVSPGEGLKINGASGTFGLDEIAIYPTALNAAAILAHWKAASEAPAGSSIIAGEAVIGGVGGAEGARIQACPTTGGPCEVDPWAVESSGRFHMLVPDGSYTATIFPPADLKDAPRIFGPMGLPPSVLNLTATFSPPGGLQEGVSLSSPGRGTQENVVPGLNWGEPSTVTDTGCKNGVGITSIAGTNIATGQPETISAPLLENPTGSGTYQAAIRPLAPVHGGATGTDVIDCPSKLGLVPSGGPPSGGTTVLLNAPGGLTGATAVDFGTTPASSFTVLTENFIVATAPPGSGSVAVTVTGSGGNMVLIGTYTYLQVASLSIGSGPATGGTTLTITGQGFQSGDQVLFGLVPSPSVTYISSTQLEVVTPPGVGTVDIQVVQGNSVSAPTNTALYVNQGGPPGTSNLNQSTTSPQAYAQDISEACSVPVGGVTLVEQDAQLCGAADFAKNVYGEGTDDLRGALADPLVQFLKGMVAYGLTDNIASGAELANLIEFGLGVWDGVWEAQFMIDLGNDACKILVGTDCRWDFWNLFIDPSGTIVDTQGNPISGATATLLEQPLASGPFTQVEASSGAIEPAENPETTKTSGQFDWNALAGTYQVEASAPECHAPGEERQPDVFTLPFVLPPPAVGLMLTLECAGGTAPTPKVTGLSVSGGATAGGNIVDILGEGLADVTSVHFGGNVSVHVQSLSPYALAAVAPAGSGTVDVTVSGAGGTSAMTEVDHYTYSTPVVTENSPVVESVTPSSGPLSGGTVVTIKGSHLDGAFSVAFGATSSTQVTPISASEVEAVAPAAAFPARVDTTVTTSSGDSTPTLADGFTYGSPPPPVTTSVTLTPSPNPVTAGQAVGMTAAVAPTDGGGTIAFYADGSSMPLSGCGAQTLSHAGASYQATCSTTTLAVGSHTLSAVYSGDASYAGSSGSANLSIDSVPEPTGGGSTIGSGGGSGGGSPGAKGGVLGNHSAKASAAQIAALLARQLTPSGRGAKIAALVRRGGWAELFRALEAGTAVIDWYELPKGATLAKKTKVRPELVAAGRLTFSAAGTATLNVKLTSTGKRLLKHANHLKLTAKGTFAPPGMTPIVATKTFVLKR
jgi:hypothetical protein